MESLSKKRKISETPEEKSPEMRKEFIRLISQALYDLGYEKSAQQLEQESGICFETPEVKVFRQAMLAGNWDQVAEIVPEFKIPQKNELQVKLCVKQQKYLEQISSGEFSTALHTLRNEVTPIHDSSKNLHLLASLLLCKNSEELKENTEIEYDRKKILQKVQNFIPSSVMIPNSRLLVLTGQALEYQINTCEKHCGFFRADTLLEDHSCDNFSLPSKPLHVLNEHNEVWDCIFSHNSEKILIICKSSSFSVWDILQYSKTLNINTEVSAANWSLDDKRIVVGTLSGDLKIFEISGTLVQTLREHEDKVTSIQFLVNNVMLTGAVDRKLILWDNFAKVKTIDQRVRQIEKSLLSNTVVVLNAAKNEVTSYSFMPLEKNAAVITEEDSITSIQINIAGTQILTVVSLTSPKINLWSLTGELLQTFEGFAQEKFILRPCFAGPSEDLIAIGSENGKLHIWSKLHGSHLGEVSSHTSSINCVVMNPKSPSVILSCGDDCMIKLWNLDPREE